MEKMQNNFNISIIHPTCRPGIARETREKWLDLASKPDLVEYLLCIDSDILCNLLDMCNYTL